MIENQAMLLAVFERAALMLMALFFLTRTRPFQHLLRKQDHSPAELAAVSLLFCLFAVFSTYTGIPVDGSLVNVRIIAILSGGILFGPWVGIPAGIVSGLHRYLIDINGYTSLPCLISSVCAGLLATWIHCRAGRGRLWLYGILAGMLCEGLTMGLILLLTEPAVGVPIVRHIAFPMIVGTVCVGLIIKLVQDLNDEKELLAARQAKLALTIANRTLPYFQNLDRDAMVQVCTVIRDQLDADAVAITNTSDVLAYVGLGKDYYEMDEHSAIGAITRQAIAGDQIIIENNLQQYHLADFHSVIIIPLREKAGVSGTLKIFYRKSHGISTPLREVAVGLSQLISTQMEVSRVKQLEEMARKAEFSALQSKINPHFLFNALNAISSLIRIQPQQARQLISNLADYLRYNLSLGDRLIDIQEELQQVRDYVAIEQARFGAKLTVEFDIDDVHVRIPSLLLQPLVENAILHGIQPRKEPGRVSIAVKRDGDKVHVCVRDTGYGVSQEVLDGVAAGTLSSRSIGLSNVNQRLKLLYGEGLRLTRLEPGTAVCFDLPATEEPAC
ncbi:two-component system LytT family sensor kinase [Chromobacterium alkanivorans]|uniref:sensor histidine kinase n=1 Tax=Chromobacterium alkanivorans TaxID=1071719 RepID=UPI0021696AB5|nr:sensor histidine kinase [Chromobacterium alkanivorans]MCS3804386.1 two-component system LytT family sensor kinase [Chromobacterium alkanivorans]MCS3818394.1 two-component system LytT family sensor kinase [Chromobacterium alkanivorans]MCS3873670.1 two-component system LytT family sensor kinase [Chromobacterium alkanivorans]